MIFSVIVIPMVKCFDVHPEANLAFRFDLHNEKNHPPASEVDKKGCGCSVSVLCPVIAGRHAGMLPELLVEV